MKPAERPLASRRVRVADPELVIRRMGADDVAAVLNAGRLFDAAPDTDATVRFLSSDTHHLFIAYLDGRPAGFISGIETSHPDKGTEMMLYELGVDEASRRRGIGTRLTEVLRELAVALGCYGMWVPIEPSNVAAVATYRNAGAAGPEPAATMSWDLRRRR